MNAKRNVAVHGPAVPVNSNKENICSKTVESRNMLCYTKDVNFEADEKTRCGFSMAMNNTPPAYRVCRRLCCEVKDGKTVY